MRQPKETSTSCQKRKTIVIFRNKEGGGQQKERQRARILLIAACDNSDNLQIDQGRDKIFSMPKKSAKCRNGTGRFRGLTSKRRARYLFKINLRLCVLR